jgi:hypothetical protein
MEDIINGKKTLVSASLAKNQKSLSIFVFPEVARILYVLVPTRRVRQARRIQDRLKGILRRPSTLLMTHLAVLLVALYAKNWLLAHTLIAPSAVRVQ